MKTWKWLAFGAALALVLVAGSGAVAPAVDKKVRVSHAGLVKIGGRCKKGEPGAR